MKIDYKGRVYTVHPRSSDLGVIRYKGKLVAGYSYGGESKGYHVMLATSGGEARGPNLVGCVHELLSNA